MPPFQLTSLRMGSKEKKSGLGDRTLSLGAGASGLTHPRISGAAGLSSREFQPECSRGEEIKKKIMFNLKIRNWSRL